MTSLPPRRPKRPNRRVHERVAVDTPARLVAGRAALDGRTEDISLHGAAFVTPQMEPEFAVGARVTLVLPGGGEKGADVAFGGRVVRVAVLCDVRGDIRSYALEFDQPLDM